EFQSYALLSIRPQYLRDMIHSKTAIAEAREPEKGKGPTSRKPREMGHPHVLRSVILAPAQVWATRHATSCALCSLNRTSLEMPKGGLIRGTYACRTQLLCIFISGMSNLQDIAVRLGSLG